MKNTNEKKYYRCEHCHRDLKGLLGLSIHLTKLHGTVLPYLKVQNDWIEHLKSFEVSKVIDVKKPSEVEELKVLFSELLLKFKKLEEVQK